MRKINNYFDYLHFTECDILSYKWEVKIKPSFNSQSVSYHQVSNLLVPIKNLGILQGHPLNPPTHESSIIFWPKRCTCIFKEVQTSILHLYRYCEVPPGSQQFVPNPHQTPQEIEDVFSVDDPLNEFGIEGMYKDPVAWVDWDIKSGFFALEIDPKDEQWVLTGLEYSKLHANRNKVQVM